jgi:hypothetical protein
MTFQIEQETEHLINGEIKTTYWVWVKYDDSLTKCFSLHQTLEDAKLEIEKIKDIFPEYYSYYVSLPEHFPKQIEVFAERILDRNDNYTIKDVYILRNENRFILRKEKLDDIMDEAQKICDKITGKHFKKSEIVFELEK